MLGLKRVHRVLCGKCLGTQHYTAPPLASPSHPPLSGPGRSGVSIKEDRSPDKEPRLTSRIRGHHQPRSGAPRSYAPGVRFYVYHLLTVSRRIPRTLCPLSEVLLGLLGRFWCVSSLFTSS